ncbi:MAG: PHP domain-containing protein, partial [Deltaproteobacteria bacterium]|nr:PHP domain-containing protein [Deltaproteobacteria bacterium]
MAASQFVHLHLHTQYSLLDGANKIPDVLEQAHKLGQPAIAMTDHGNLHGAIEFYLEAKRIGIKAIIGCELYVTPGSRTDRKPRAQGGGGTYHLTALAQDLEGYHNLCRLVSLAYREGFYFKPRVDHELLERFNKGLIVTSGCLNGEVAGAAANDDEKGVKSVIDFYATHFRDRFYMEVQPHAIPEQRKLNDVCAHFAKSKGLPLVATTDCHYASKDDHYAQEVLMCVSTGKQITDPDRLRHVGVDLHLKSYDEMVEGFGDWTPGKEAIENSLLIADACNLKFDFSKYYMPQFKTGDEQPLIDLMAGKAREGLERRLEVLEKAPAWKPEMRKGYLDRLELEIKLIDK